MHMLLINHLCVQLSVGMRVVMIVGVAIEGNVGTARQGLFNVSLHSSQWFQMLLTCTTSYSCSAPTHAHNSTSSYSMQCWMYAQLFMFCLLPHTYIAVFECKHVRPRAEVCTSWSVSFSSLQNTFLHMPCPKIIAYAVLCCVVIYTYSSSICCSSSSS